MRLARLTAAFFVLGVLFVGCSESTDGGDDNAGGDGAGGDTQTSETVGLNAPVRDGKFEFVVQSIDCSKTEVGENLAGTLVGKKAQGKFCFVNMTVKNIGNEAQFFSGDSQKLFDNQDREFSADTEAAVYVDESKSLFEEINPGNQLTGIVIFDVPQDAQPVKLELHDSAFSGGVTITLT